jgi:hypothetical protein
MTSVWWTLDSRLQRIASKLEPLMQDVASLDIDRAKPVHIELNLFAGQPYATLVSISHDESFYFTVTAVGVAIGVFQQPKLLTERTDSNTSVAETVADFVVEFLELIEQTWPGSEREQQAPEWEVVRDAQQAILRLRARLTDRRHGRMSYRDLYPPLD